MFSLSLHKADLKYKCFTLCIMETACTGYAPLAVSPDNITQSAPSVTAFPTSVISARVGRGFLIIDSNIYVIKNKQVNRTNLHDWNSQTFPSLATVFPWLPFVFIWSQVFHFFFTSTRKSQKYIIYNCRLGKFILPWLWTSRLNSLTIPWQSPWQFPDNSLTTPWQLPDNSLTTPWQLPGSSLTTLP